MHTLAMDIIHSIQADPSAILTSECVLSLHAFMVGCKTADASLSPLFAGLAGEIVGPDKADGFTRAYLAHADTRQALRYALGLLETLARKSDFPAMDTSTPVQHFVDTVRDAILQGRPGMVLPEPTITSLADYANGHIAGLRGTHPRAASAHKTQLAAFDRWLGQEYGGHKAPWYGLIRIDGGPCEHSLRRFLDLWDEFMTMPAAEPKR